MTTAALVAELEGLGRRFAGVDVQFRRDAKAIDWPHPWRVRLLASKNERAAYRVTVYGASFEDAARTLLAAVGSVWYQEVTT